MNARVTIEEVIHHLEQTAPIAYQESYDNSGLQTGDLSAPVEGILISLDCTEAVIREAITRKCNLVITHHPLIFNGIKRLSGSNEVERTLMLAIRNHVSVYAMHTNLDHIEEGVNAKIASRLGLIQTRILLPRKDLLRKLVTFVPHAHAESVSHALFDAGAGHIGKYDQCSFASEGTGTFRGGAETHPFVGIPGNQHLEPEVRIEVIFPAHIENRLLKRLFETHPYEEPAFDILKLENSHTGVGSGLLGTLPEPMTPDLFLRHVKDKMQTGVIRYTPREGPILKVALCGGSGFFLLKTAIAAGADAFITADIKYHQFFDAESKLLLADIGHYESEIFTTELLKDLILKKFTTFAVLLSETQTNPIKYY